MKIIAEKVTFNDGDSEFSIPMFSVEIETSILNEICEDIISHLWHEEESKPTIEIDVKRKT